MHKRSLVILLLAAQPLAGCLVLRPGDFTCDTEQDCPPNMACALGYCGGPATDGSGEGEPGTSSGYAELTATDPLRRTYDFLRAAYGSIEQEGEIRNSGSHIDWGNYSPGDLTVGIQGGERGAIVHLGSDAEVAARLGVQNTVGGGQGYAALTWHDEERLGTALEEESAALARARILEGEDERHAAGALGGVYVLRVLEEEEGLDLVVKLLVTVLDGAERIGFQWHRLRP